MASTSEVATAPASSGAASRPARAPAVARGWRVLRTGVAFFTFGVGAIVVGGIVWPLRLLPEGTSARREVTVQRVVRAAFRLFAWWMFSLGLIRVSWIGADRLRGRAPRLVVANHPTLIDVVLLLAQLPQADCIVKTATRPSTPAPSESPGGARSCSFPRGPDRRGVPCGGSSEAPRTSR